MAERPNGNPYRTERVPYVTVPKNPPALSEIAEVLQNGMQPLFQQVTVDIASCPCLTKPPYNLAGVGLGGNTSIIEFLRHNEDAPWNHITRDIRVILSSSCRDSFIIGSSYASKPHMPHYGHVRVINIFYMCDLSYSTYCIEFQLCFYRTHDSNDTITVSHKPDYSTVAMAKIHFELRFEMIDHLPTVLEKNDRDRHRRQEKEEEVRDNFTFIELRAENSRRFRNFAIRPPPEGTDIVRWIENAFREIRTYALHSCEPNDYVELSFESI
ncbi:hypothetical protein ALC56_13780 [Trachymyrmex septentrionalis]|uniref:DUF1907 domain-containing protein n=1 Tax=Trachymyrmex septentrionalis TaxID=34720 RepID=A0A151JT76_9HYME|nr:hypothetical protein ALC56_13780 [Trachymyrmex septentrionalis]